ncbi:hypothetical protein DXG01_011573 [Tephrocybe rancida]|nr:hypothetical protein DXG01_011573 [Tephrocybe rancida]
MASDSAQPSWSTIFHAPPDVKYPYVEEEALGDLPGVCYALEMFLASHMVESEDYCRDSDTTKERLYFTTGYGLIQCVKGLMSYADEDLLSAINHTKHGNHIASQHRKKAGFFGSLVGSGSTTTFIKSMTPVERHAELLYAESLFLKALLGIVYSGDWLAFIKEALNMRTTIGVYRHLGAYLDEADEAYAASLASSNTPSTSSSSTTTPSTSASSSTTSLSASTPSSSVPPSQPFISPDTPTTPKAAPPKPSRKLEDPSIDPHFRSGVYLGTGMCNIILSLIPGKLATLIELFGYKGDRRAGLAQLMRAGGWDGEGGTPEEPAVGTAEEGVRRTICDMALLIFHLVLSTITVDGVDIKVATKILEWNLKRYPNGVYFHPFYRNYDPETKLKPFFHAGVFFLFGAGRLALHHSQPRAAIDYYTRAMASQIQYRNLDHISFWEVAVARLALWEVGEEVPGEDLQVQGKEGTEKVGGSAACWRVLEQEATWSKSIYSYGLAACLLEDWDTDTDTPEGKKKKEERMKEAEKLMARVPHVRQKIAGKSIPLEKFVARKARKFATQKNRLLLPALEVAYIFQAIAHAPRSVVTRKMLPPVRAALAKLSQYGDGTGLDAEPVEPVSAKSTKSFMSALSRASEKSSTRKGKNPSAYEGGVGEYWDDLCLARFLEGVCLRFIAYPDPDAVLHPEEVVDIPRAEAEAGAEEAFRAVFEYGPKIELDHHIVYHAHYELGRLLACQGDLVGARTEFELVLSGKIQHGGTSALYLNALHIRAHAALDALSNTHKA